MHRWSSLVLGLALVLVTTSGSILLYNAELTRWAQADNYSEATPGMRAGQPPITLPEATRLVAEYDPAFHPATVHYSRGTIVAEDYDSGRRVVFDEQTGERVADFNAQDRDGAVLRFLGLTENIHYCFFSCEEYPGHVGFLGNEVPGTGWLGFDGARVTWGGVLLGASGVLLIFLAVSGVWLWWPGVKRWAHGVRVRLDKGRYARDYDLHQVLGMVTLPFLLMWGLTGAGFEFGWVEKAWYAATPGTVAAEVEFTSTPPPGLTSPPEITPAGAYSAAERTLDGQEITGIEYPAAAQDDPTGTYTVYFVDGVDAYRAYEDYPGDAGVAVDRYSGQAELTSGLPDRSDAALLWEDWGYATHAGFFVGPWQRIVWCAAGMMPLVLMVTGLSTWLFKRKVRKRKAQAKAGRNQGRPLVVDLDDDGNQVEVELAQDPPVLEPQRFQSGGTAGAPA